MHFLRTKRQERVRAAAAWMCLLTVAFLYAPLAGAAWHARSMDCCADGFCPMSAHHHHQQQKVPAGHSQPMDCGHDMGGDDGMATCSISCCQSPSHPTLVSGAFLLPPGSLAPARNDVLRPVQIAKARELSRLVAPLSPPPKPSIQNL